MSSWAVSSSDLFIIAILLGTNFTGYYGPGYALGSIIFMFLSPFNIHLTPVITKLYEENKIGNVKEYLRHTQKYFLLLSIPSVIGLSFLSKPILLILTTPQIAQNGYLVTPFVALGALIWCISSNYRQILLLEKKTKMMGYIWVFAALINVGLNIIMIPYWGILGAAFSTLVAYF